MQKRLKAVKTFGTHVLFLGRNYNTLLFLLGIVLPSSTAYFIFGETFVVAWFICVCNRIAVIQHIALLINSVAHHYGYRTYDK